jgi:hypothetical protein
MTQLTYKRLQANQPRHQHTGTAHTYTQEESAKHFVRLIPPVQYIPSESRLMAEWNQNVLMSQID